MTRSFAPAGGTALALAHGVFVIGLLSVFGTLAFQTFVAPRCFRHAPAVLVGRFDRQLLAMNRVGTLACVAALLAWWLLQAADMANATAFAKAVAAVPTVVSDTSFGHLIVLQLALAVVLPMVLGRHAGRLRRQIGLALATASVALQAGHSHAASLYGAASFLLVSDIVHLLAAGAWLGGLVPLLLAVRAMPVRVGASAARWFSPLGQVCIVASVLSAVFQGWVMVGSLAGLVGTAYGWMAMVKLSLFGVLFGFAVVNRYVLAPALLTSAGIVAKRRLVRSIAVQTGFALAIVAAAVLLSSLAPAMHEQPNWPFADRFSLATISEDPDLRNEVVGAVMALFCAAVLLIVAVLVKQRVRWLAAVGVVILCWFAVPHLDLLFVPAYPTSYYRSPTGFAATTIVAGAALFPAHCAACHGKQGRGDGLAAHNNAPSAADLAAPHLWMHSDGELFWWLSHGIDGPRGRLVMPGFANALSEDDRWDLIDYIRAHNAGLTFQATGTWSPPLHAPDLQAMCDGGRTVSLADLKGGFVRVVFGTHPPALDAAVTTILATSSPTATSRPGLCIADDGTLPQAYAIAAGLDASQIGKAEFLIDGDGWLRAEQHDGAWTDPSALTAAIQRLAAHPIAASSEEPHSRMQM